MADQTTTDIEIQRRDPQATVAVRVREPMATVDVGRVFGDAMTRLAARIGDVGAASAGPPFTRYHDWGRELADMEIGFPLASRPDGLADLDGLAEGEIGVSTLPGGEILVLVHRGPYPTLGEAYRRLDEWLGEHGRQGGPGPWESYVDNPAEVEDVATLRTDVCWPLID